MLTKLCNYLKNCIKKISNFATPTKILTNRRKIPRITTAPGKVDVGDWIFIINMETLDLIDIKLLKLLQNNSRLTTKELAQEVGLSISPVYERVKRLENEGYIERYVALLNPEKITLSFIAYVAVKLSKQTKEGAAEFFDVVQNIAEVTECYSVAGRYDYLMKVYAPDMRYYRNFVLDVLGKLDSICNIESTFVMAQVKQTTALPLRQLGHVD